MAQYPVPPDLSEKEKIVGGLLTAAQLICLIAGIGGMAIFSLVFFQFLNNIAIIIGAVVFLPLGCLFAFLKIKGLPLFTYLKLKSGHKKKVKKLPNHKKEVDDFELSYLARDKIINHN